jgi:hypothetical protein
MTKKINKLDFEKLEFDEKCSIIETLLTDDYFNGQTEINFYVPEGFKGEIGEPLPETPPDIKEIEDRKFEALIDKLTIKLFAENDEIEYEDE